MVAYILECQKYGLDSRSRHKRYHFPHTHDTGCHDHGPVQAMSCMVVESTVCVCICKAIACMYVIIALKYLQVQGHECSSMQCSLRQGFAQSGQYAYGGDIREPTWCSDNTLAQNTKDVSQIPALGTLFPIFVTPTAHVYPLIHRLGSLLYLCYISSSLSKLGIAVSIHYIFLGSSINKGEGNYFWSKLINNAMV